MRIESSGEGRARIIGGLETSVLRTLLEGTNGGALALDLSEVYAAEGGAVRLLSELPSDRYQLIGCPQWLAVWLESERRRLSAEMVDAGPVEQGRK